MTHLVLSTDLRLEPLGERHVARLFALLAQHGEALARWLPWVATVPSATELGELVASLCADAEHGEAYAWIVHVDGAAAGMASLQEIDRASASASLGVWIVPPAQRRGAARRALSALVDHAFDVLHLARVEYLCAPDNEASLCLARALGLQREADLVVAEPPGVVALFAVHARERR